MSTPKEQQRNPQSLRDWFAGLALFVVSDMDSKHATEIAKRAYAIADAMLRERAK